MQSGRSLMVGLMPLLIVLLACQTATTSGPEDVEPIMMPPTPTIGSSTQPMPPQDRWEQLAPGIEWRGASITAHQAEDAEYEVSVTMMRLDPALVAIRVHYTPDDPMSISAWQERLPSAVVITNGGFFLGDGRAIGILVCDGFHHNDEPGYPEWGGVLTIAGDRADVRSHTLLPYNPAEPISQAIEGYPMLLYANASPVPFESDPARIAPRTVAARDINGRVLLMATGAPGISLALLRGWLEAEVSNLEIDSALNLDGGRSTGLIVRVSEVDWLLDSVVEVPAVIAVYGN